MAPILFLCCPALKFSSSTVRTADSFNCLKNLLSPFNIVVETLFLTSHENDLASSAVNSFFDHIFFSPPQGVYPAYNMAVRLSIDRSADWVWILGEGDTILCDNLDPLILSQKLSLCTDILMMNMYIGDRSEKCRLKKASPYPILNLDTMRFNHPACIISANAYLINGLYSLDFKVVSDYYWFHKLSLVDFSIIHLPFSSVYHELGGLSTSLGKSRFLEHYQCLLVLKRVYGFSPYVLFAFISRLIRYLLSGLFR